MTTTPCQADPDRWLWDGPEHTDRARADRLGSAAMACRTCPIVDACSPHEWPGASGVLGGHVWVPAHGAQRDGRRLQAMHDSPHSPLPDGTMIRRAP